VDTRDLLHEIKLLLPAVRAPLALGLLAALCRRDGEHPESQVISLYFDTPDLAGYREKRASEYLKTKWRLRWYRVEGAIVEPAFVERKDRVGTRRRKRRAGAPVAARFLDRLPLAAMRAQELLSPLLDAGELPPASLQACLRLEYRRRRFLEPLSGARISFDTEIRAGAVHPYRGALRDPRPLAVAVLEVKGPLARLPRLLEPITALGGRRSSFSKYAAVLEQQGLATDHAA
jgi:hypothetical protein